MLRSDEWVRSGQNVTGVYCFEPYKGKILGVRSVGGKTAVFTVELQSPIIVFGQQRNRIEIWSNGNDVINFAD
jgi:hypothetical protein